MKNREIKFRVWNTKAKCFYTESHVKEHLLGYFATAGEPVMQYTGLKDKNGKEIFEGDIVKSIEEYNTYTGMRADIYGGQVYQIVWKRRGFTVEPDPITGHIVDWNEIEIIGNIYETPDLLK